jgi:hypothetical protein
MRKRPIGRILVEKNEISEAELAVALAEQERTGLRLGQILIETGRISWLALARAIAEQVLDIEDVARPPEREPEPAPLPTYVRPDSAVASPLQRVPAPAAPAAAPPPAPVAPELIHDPEIKLHSVEALLKERQRAFIELVTTAETLRMKIVRLEEIIEERDRELTRLRVLRVS